MFTPTADPSGLRRAITLPYSFRQGMGQNLTPRGPQILVYFYLYIFSINHPTIVDIFDPYPG